MNTRFARVYTYFISRKKYSPLHMACVSFWFSVVLSVKAWKTKHSHGQQSIHTDGERLWRVERASLHTGKPPRNQEEIGINASLCCEYLKFQAFTLETTENQTETHVVWRGEYFFREMYHVYTRARKTYSPNGLRLLQCDLPASSARSDTAWCSFHKSPTIFYNSASWQNNSWTFGNNSRTF